MAALEEKLAEAVRHFPVLCDKSCKDFKENSKERLAWDDVAKQVGLQTALYSRSEYSFICLMFSLCTYQCQARGEGGGVLGSPREFDCDAYPKGGDFDLTSCI